MFKRCGLLLAAGLFNWSAALPASAYIHYGDLGDLTVGQPLQGENLDKVKRLPVSGVICLPGADPHLFDSINPLRQLDTVRFAYDRPEEIAKYDIVTSEPQVLKACTFEQKPHEDDTSPESIGRLMIPLASNHPNLQSLYIHCKDEIPSTAISQIRSFKHLRRLGLKGNLAKTSSFGQCVPESLHEVWIDSSNLTERNPNILMRNSIKTLDIRKCTITGKFIGNLRAENLKELNLRDCKMTDDAISAITKMPSLRKITINSGVSIPLDAVQAWRERKIKVLLL